MQLIRKQGVRKSRGRNGAATAWPAALLLLVGRPYQLPLFPYRNVASNNPLSTSKTYKKHYGEHPDTQCPPFFEPPTVPGTDSHRCRRQADGTGDAGSFQILVDTAFSRIKEIERAQQNIGCSSNILDQVQAQQNGLSQSLEALIREPQRRTPHIVEDMQVVIGVQNDLRDLLGKVQKNQSGGAVKSFMQIMSAGSQEDRQLAQILGRLHRARQNLLLREEGLYSNDTRFDNADAYLHKTSASRDNLDWQRNKTQNEPSFWVGNVGYEATDQLAVPRAHVNDSEFGNGLRFSVGHVSPQGATSFMDHFFRRS
ncbi:hypothetical protein QQZ08_002812 [Neonectria magnoliae]|uniref:Uncharacterized protein n=1 Tax=Neonectria magnoliae TaxID=2732573 RepID=A0ABR1IAY1_9HYPO